MCPGAFAQAGRVRRPRGSPLIRYLLAPSHVSLAVALVLSWVVLLGSGPHGDHWRADTRAAGADASSRPPGSTRLAALATSASR